jgi:hypothetical protein
MLYNNEFAILVLISRGKVAFTVTLTGMLLSTTFHVSISVAQAGLEGQKTNFKIAIAAFSGISAFFIASV